MVKILIAANNLAGGGAEKVLLMLLETLKPSEYTVDLLLIKNKGVYMNDLPSNIRVMTMIDVSHGDRPFPTEPATLEKYCNEHLSRDYDTEVAFLEGPPTKLIAYHFNTHARKIAWVHTDLQNVHWTHPYYCSDEEERSVYERFDKVVFVSEGGKQGFLKRFGILYTPCSVITNPTDVDAIRTKFTAFCVLDYPFCFCTVASLCARKGQSRLLYAMRRLFDEGFQFHLNLVGDGENLSFLKELAHMLDIYSNVHFCGFQRNPYPYIAHCDAFISSSLSEGFPLVLCEALCLNRPIIATRCAGNRDVLQDGRFGLLVDNTEEGIYQGMRQVLVDRAFLAKLGELSCAGSNSLQYDAIIAQIHKLLSGEEVDKH